jgi:predicted alpha/beta-fold hydrolase
MSAAPPAPYRAPRWLPGGHLQTLYASLAAPRPRVSYRRERWDTPDGDFIDLDWLTTPPADHAQPLVVLFHGLEGNSQSQYALALMAAARDAGWRGVVVHFRGCSGEINRLRRAYHSGDSTEIDWILRRLRAGHAGGPLFVCGVSLGGNALLKWLGEQQAAALPVVAAAAAVSAPLDLMASGNALDAGFNLIYTKNFLRTMKQKALEKLARFPGLFDRQRLLTAATLREFDDLVTAPLHGYRDTDDYWTRASSKPLLRQIAVPTLVLNARNDPFLPAAALPRADEAAAAVRLEFPQDGGHVGFVDGAFPGRLDWLPQRLLAHFAEVSPSDAIMASHDKGNTP